MKEKMPRETLKAKKSSARRGQGPTERAEERLGKRKETKQGEQMAMF